MDFLHRRPADPKRAAGRKRRTSRKPEPRVTTKAETSEHTRDLGVFQRELVDGTRAMLGVEIASPTPTRDAGGAPRPLDGEPGSMAFCPARRRIKTPAGRCEMNDEGGAMTQL
jgi:hypothetical protein